MNPRLLAAILAAAAVACSRPGPPPNLVVIVVDTLRPDHLGTYGYSRPTSPNLDRFARGAVVFENAQSSAPWTAPALITLMTSLHPDVHGVVGHPNPGRMSERVVTLAEVLRARGWRTGAFTEGGYAKGAFGLDQGFEVFPSNPGDEDSNVSNLEHPSRLAGNVDRALAWMREVKDEPFFLFFHTYEVHSPFRPPDEHLAVFRPGEDRRAKHERLRAAIGTWNAEQRMEAEDAYLLIEHNVTCACGKMPRLEHQPALREELARHGLTSAERLEVPDEITSLMRDLYDAEIRFTDEELARLLAELDALGLSGRTVVVVTSDHGELFGERGEIGHGKSLAQELLRIALLLRAPDLSPRRVEPVVRSIDVAPTVLDLLGVDAPEMRPQGRSLLPLLEDRPPLELQAFSHAVARPDEVRDWHAVRSGRWLYVEEPGGRHLYDLQADPGQAENLVEREPEVAAKLGDQLERQRRVDRALADAVAGEVEEHELSQEDIEELKRLGYLGD